MKISKLVYGKNGLITFLNRLFFDTSSNDRKKFNYYFALKKHLNYMDEYSLLPDPEQHLEEECKDISPD